MRPRPVTLIGCIALAMFASACATPLLTQVIVVRHAEKASADQRDPDLSEAGHRRALALSEIVAPTGLAAVFATELRRTQATVTPTARALNLPLVIVPAKDPAALVERIRRDFAGRVVLVAAHSNTIPQVIAHLGGPTIEDLPEDAYDDIFVVTSSSATRDAHLLHLRYPAPGPPARAPPSASP